MELTEKDGDEIAGTDVWTEFKVSISFSQRLWAQSNLFAASQLKYCQLHRIKPCRLERNTNEKARDPFKRYYNRKDVEARFVLAIYKSQQPSDIVFNRL